MTERTIILWTPFLILYLPGLPLFRTAYTYFNITQSPLVPAFIKGSVSKVVLVSIFQITIFQVTRGWGQVIKLDGSLYSIDPDEPGDKNFNYTWFCRRSPLIGFSNKFYLVRTDGGGEKLDNGLEGPEMFKEYYTIDSDGDGTDEEYPVYKNYEAQRIPKTRDPMIINPLPGCFGYGPGPVKVKGPRLTLNTSSFVTYAQVKTHQSCCSTHQ